MGLTKSLWSPLASHTITGLEATNPLFKILSHFRHPREQIPTVFPCRGQLGVTMAVTWMPQLHSTPTHMEPIFPGLKASFSSVGPQHPCTCPQGGKENVLFFSTDLNSKESKECDSLPFKRAKLGVPDFCRPRIPTQSGFLGQVGRGWVSSRGLVSICFLWLEVHPPALQTMAKYGLPPLGLSPSKEES